MDYTALKAALIDLIGFDSNTTDITGWTGSSGLSFNSVHPFINGLVLSALTQEADKTTWLRKQIQDHIATCLSLWIAQKTNIGELDTLLEDIALCGKSLSMIDKAASPIHTNASGLRLITSGSLKRSRVTSIGLCFATSGTKTITFDLDGEDPVNADFEYLTEGYTQWFDVDHSFRTIAKVTHGETNALDEPKGQWNCSKHVLFKGLRNGEDFSGSNFGINLRIETSCDFTDWMKGKAKFLAPMIAQYVGVQLLLMLKANPEALNNRHSHNYSIQDIEFDINGDPRGRDDFSVNGKYKRLLKASTFSKTEIDSECIRKKRQGVTIKAIGGRGRRYRP